MLQVISVEEACALVRGVSPAPRETELLPLSALAGRVLAEPLFAPEPVPAFARSTMDGFAVIAADTFGAGESAPAFLTVAGNIRMGEETALSLTPGCCARIPTGGMLPRGADAVIPVEYTEEDGFGACLIYRAAPPGENVIPVGGDLEAGACLFEAGARFTPSKIGALAAAGITACRVWKRPRVGILSTGNELVPADAPLPKGRVRDVNSHLLFSLVSAFGCEAKTYPIAPDELPALVAALETAAEENDLVLLSGGSSAGQADLTAAAIGSLGAVLAHGIAMKPGKPTVIGKIGETPVLGLPGHPAACYFVCETVAAAAIERLSGAPLPRSTVPAILSEHLSSNHGREEFVCVALQNGAAVPVYGKSGVVSQLSQAAGYVRIPRESEGLPAGSSVTVYLF